MENKNLIAAYSILGLAIIISAVFVANTFYKVKALDNTLTVTGSAKQQVKADLVKWQSSFSRTVSEVDLKQGYQEMEQDLQKVLVFFKNNNIKESDLLIPPIEVDEVYKYEQNYGLKTYILRQSIELQSNDIAGITNLAKSTKELVDKGVFFTSDRLEYYYSKLADLRIELLGEAIRDARARADIIAKSSGKKVGVIKQASMGVVQVLPLNSTNISDYGEYDTSTIDKEVMVTVRALFTIK
ncbi:MAG: SIMPL domain-containing protein [Bacteroidales bacterium]|nr:SIMPL domain-containing protein [Bacteroidales bacterium]